MSVKLLKTTTDGAVSQKSNEIHLKLNDCQLNRYFVDTSGLLATWPEFWAIGLSFLGLYSEFCDFSLCGLLAHPCQPAQQGCISCGILVSGIRARGVSSEHMENMEMFSCSPT